MFARIHTSLGLFTSYMWLIRPQRFLNWDGFYRWCSWPYVHSNLEGQGLSFVRSLPCDQSGKVAPTRDWHSSQHSSRDHWDTQAPPPPQGDNAQCGVPGIMPTEYYFWKQLQIFLIILSTEVFHSNDGCISRQLLSNKMIKDNHTENFDSIPLISICPQSFSKLSIQIPQLN